MKEQNKFSLIWNGIIKENPVLVLVLGTCPTLAISTTVSGAVGMGIAATFVLVCSNMAISAIRNIIPDKIRIPCYITIIAAFVTIVMMLIEAFVPALHASLGIYLPLIVVNCIILGRAEMYASKNTVTDSMLDGMGMGFGFTATLTVMATARELIGNGTWYGIRIIPERFSIGIMTMTPGGFFTFGFVMAMLAAILAKKGKKPLRFSLADGCDGCPLAANCIKTQCDDISAKGDAGNG